MTVMMTMDLPIPRADLEAVSADLGTHDNPPEGLIVHVATATADGVHVTDIWESQAAFEKFRDDQLMPSMAKRLNRRSTRHSTSFGADKYHLIHPAGRRPGA